MTNSIVIGSIGAIARSTGQSIARTFADAKAVVIVDTSGSMDIDDAAGGRTRYAVACEELAKLQAAMPGQVAVISFATDVQFCPGGVPVNLGGGTALGNALAFARIADAPGMRMVVVSDGQPDSESEAIREAGKYKHVKFDTIYVGPEGGSGQAFLKRLAAACGGQSLTADRVKELAASTERLLLNSGTVPSPTIRL